MIASKSKKDRQREDNGSPLEGYSGGGYYYQGDGELDYTKQNIPG